MTPKNLFLAILKILGIFFIKDIVEALPQVFTGILYLDDPLAKGNGMLFIYSLLILIVYVIVSYLLIFKSEMIVRKLRLDKAFDEESFSFNLSLHDIFVIAIIITGLFLIIIEIPNLCQQLYMHFRMVQLTSGKINPKTSSIVYSGVKILIGLLLIGERKRIAHFISKKQQSA